MVGGSIGGSGGCTLLLVLLVALCMLGLHGVGRGLDQHLDLD